jgi:hypothetical protein
MVAKLDWMEDRVVGVKGVAAAADDDDVDVDEDWDPPKLDVEVPALAECESVAMRCAQASMSANIERPPMQGAALTAIFKVCCC